MQDGQIGRSVDADPPILQIRIPPLRAGVEADKLALLRVGGTGVQVEQTGAVTNELAQARLRSLAEVTDRQSINAV